MSTTGMLVQCSIQESPCRSLKESRCRALQGNALMGLVSYEQATPIGAILPQQVPIGFDGSLIPPPYFPTSYASDAAGFSMNFIGDGGAAYTTAKTAQIGTPPTWGSLPGASNPWAQNGWQIGGGFTYTVDCGLAKNTTGVVQPYFIARQQSTSSAASPAFVNSSGNLAGWPSGVVVTVYTLALISAGYIEPNQVIGLGQDINLPFPPDPTQPFAELGNQSLTGDLYYAVIGQDPANWAKLVNNLVFGTTTGLSTEPVSEEV